MIANFKSSFTGYYSAEKIAQYAHCYSSWRIFQCFVTVSKSDENFFRERDSGLLEGAEYNLDGGWENRDKNATSCCRRNPRHLVRNDIVQEKPRNVE